MIKKILIWIVIIILLISFSIYIYLQTPIFWIQSFSWERLERIKKSPNFKNWKFENLEPVKPVEIKWWFLKVLYKFIFPEDDGSIPDKEIPTKKTDLKNISLKENVLVWFWHSSYFLQIDGKKFLIDPVFSNRASPVPWFNKPFVGTNIYKAEEMPEIDFLIITHDHYDHLDYETILKLKPKIKKVFTPLWVWGHFERWWYDMTIVSEKDWWEEEIIWENSKITFTTSRHFSWRSFNRNNTLWWSYVLEINWKKIFIGWDSGYWKHFKEIWEKYWPFDFAFLENWQYNESWPEHHSMPEQVVQEAKELNTKNMIPVHSWKFRLSNHKWYEPLEKISELSKTESYNLLTPMIWEKVDLDAKEFKFEKWWKKVK